MMRALAPINPKDIRDALQCRAGCGRSVDLQKFPNGVCAACCIALTPNGQEQVAHLAPPEGKDAEGAEARNQRLRDARFGPRNEETNTDVRRP